MDEIHDLQKSIPLSQLKEGALNVVELDSGEKVVVLREGALVRAFGERCPHMGADMSEATYCAKRQTLQCRWHGYLFNAEDGQFVENPNERNTALIRRAWSHYVPEKTPRYRLQSVPIHVANGCVVLGNRRGHTPPAGEEK
jgi:nitrite reductase/ring-hydroxylating ferredoxin subunit